MALDSNMDIYSLKSGDTVICTTHMEASRLKHLAQMRSINISTLVMPEKVPQDAIKSHDWIIENEKFCTSPT